jgi:hypothetical protein
LQYFTTQQLTQIGNRLNRYLLFKKTSIDTLAREAAISSTLITNILNGGSCDFIFFLKIINLLPDLNIHWVFTGTGEMLRAAAEETNPGPFPNTLAQARPESSLLSAQAEINALRKQLEEKNAVIQRLKETLSPLQNILMGID